MTIILFWRFLRQSALSSFLDIPILEKQLWRQFHKQKFFYQLIICNKPQE